MGLGGGCEHALFAGVAWSGIQGGSIPSCRMARRRSQRSERALRGCAQTLCHFRHLRGRAQTGQRKRSAREATIRRGTSPSTTAWKDEGKAEDWIFPHSGANCPRACAMYARLRAASSTQPAQRAAQSCVMPPDRANTARPRRASLAPVILNRERIRPGLTTQAGLSRKLGPCLPKKTRPIAPACERPRHRPRGTGHAPYRGRGGRAGAAVTANSAFTN